MSRGFTGADLGPWRVCALSLGARPRLRLSLETASVVSWLSESEIVESCMGMVGSAGMFTLVGAAPRTSTELATRLADQQVGPEQASSALSDFARYAASVWRVKICLEKVERRVSLTLPEDCRKLRLVPDDDPVAVFLTPEMIELWPWERWRTHVLTLAADPEALREAVRTEVDQ